MRGRNKQELRCERPSEASIFAQGGPAARRSPARACSATAFRSTALTTDEKFRPAPIPACPHGAKILAPRLNEGCPLARVTLRAARAGGRATGDVVHSAGLGRWESGPTSRFPARRRGSGAAHLFFGPAAAEPCALFFELTPVERLSETNCACASGGPAGTAAGPASRAELASLAERCRPGFSLAHGAAGVLLGKARRGRADTGVRQTGDTLRRDRVLRTVHTTDDWASIRATRRTRRGETCSRSWITTSSSGMSWWPMAAAVDLVRRHGHRNPAGPAGGQAVPLPDRVVPGLLLAQRAEHDADRHRQERARLPGQDAAAPRHGAAGAGAGGADRDLSLAQPAGPRHLDPADHRCAI